MNQNNFDSVSADEPITILEFDKRCRNALTRAGIRTVADLVEAKDSGSLQKVYGIGDKHRNEIAAKLSQIEIVHSQQPPQPTRLSNATSSNNPHQDSFASRVVTWQKNLIRKQIDADLLHADVIVSQKPLSYWMSADISQNHLQLYSTYSTVLSASLNICDELTQLLAGMPSNYVTVLQSRYGSNKKTLQDTGDEIGLTRERVRQIGLQVHEKVFTKSHQLQNATCRIQTGLLIAKAMGLSLKYDVWIDLIKTSGLVGHWPDATLTEFSPIELLIAVCEIAGEKHHHLRLPDNLRYAVQLATSGNPEMPAKIAKIIDTLPRITRRLVERHNRFSGAVDTKWLAMELKLDVSGVIDILLALGFRQVKGNWFVQERNIQNSDLNHHEVFHNAVQKMSLYCGPLSVDEICSGIRLATSRTHFPSPPPDVMDEILRDYGYKNEEGYFYWDGETDAELSKTEAVIYDCIKRNGAVVHHSELVQAFLESALSMPALHKGLAHSPLFDKVGTGLYRLRGTPYNYADIERAKSIAERTPVDLEVTYYRNGNIDVSVCLGILAVATGVVLCEQFPNLEGEWQCYANDKQFRNLSATQSEFRHLRDVFEELDCQIGDRVTLTFNTFDRTVNLRKAE